MTENLEPTSGDLELLSVAEKWIRASDAVRTDISEPTIVQHKTETAKDAVTTWTNAAFNRTVMLYDVTRSMVDADQLFTAAIIARALLENVGMLALFLEEVRIQLPLGESAVRDLAIIFLNHSFWKRKEFRKPDAPEDIYVSPEARTKYGTVRPKVPQQGEMIAALDRLLKKSVPTLTVDLAAGFYGPLSEWTHPSQSSITYGFTSLGSVPVPTSGGPIKQSTSLKHSVAWSIAQIGVAVAVRDEVQFYASQLENHPNLSH